MIWNPFEPPKKVESVELGASANAPEPPPRKSDREPCWEFLLRNFGDELSSHAALRADIDERDRVGRAKYGVPLQPFNGRDADVDLYQELLDAVVYCTQALQEAESGHEARSKRAWLYRTLLTSLLGQCRVMSAVVNASRREQS